jgi:hypothetical protein
MATLAWAIPCRAGTPCRVDIAGSESADWRKAVGSLLASGLVDGDCATIHLDVTDDGATLTFTTIDGRRAKRVLVDPDELRATVEALLVTVPVPERPPPMSHPSRAVSSGTAAIERRSAARSEPTPGTREVEAIFALVGGARRGNDTRFSPVVSGSASLSVRRWELAVMASFEVQYFDVPNQGPAGKKSTTVAPGVVIGRREPLGEVDLIGGGRLSIAALFDDDRNRGPTELRIGAFLGVVLPRRGGTRVRAELGADLVGGSHGVAVEGEGMDDGGMDGGADVGQSGTFDPRWAVIGLVGVEFGGP